MLAADLPMLTLDPVLFEQVLFNLLDNAAKYSPAGLDDSRSRRGATATIGRAAGADEGDGIPPADLERIFDKFYRVQRGGPAARRHRARPAICRGFVEAHGRHDRARQPARTPRRRLHDQPAGARGREPRRRRCGMSQRAAPLRVLVVDDEPAIRRFLRTSLAARAMG